MVGLRPKSLMYALPVIGYPAEIVSWTQEDIDTADVKTGKLKKKRSGD